MSQSVRINNSNTPAPARAHQLRQSSKKNPCPVCGRTKDGDCRVRDDGELVICHHARNLQKGSTENGWKFTCNTKDGRAAVFVLPEKSHAIKNSAIAGQSDAIYEYSATQRIVRKTKPCGGKDFFAEHFSEADRKWSWGKGDTPWPIYRHRQIMEAVGKGEWLLFELEGEKCADIAASGGVAAFSQPGHSHKPEQVVARYRGLVGAGATLVIYVADHDDEGRKRAQVAAEAAAAAGLQLTVVHANDVWPGMPPGGSIDDAPGGPVERIAAIYAVANLSPSWEQKKALAVRGLNDPLDINDALWELLRERAVEILHSKRRIIQQRQALRAVASSLGIKLSTQEIEALYEEMDIAVSSYEPPVEAGGEFTATSQQWLLYGLIIVGLNLLVGMPGAGKSRLIIAFVRAFLSGQQTFLQRELMDGTDKQVLIIGTDQDRQQWGALLAEQGLATVVSNENVNGIVRHRYRLHARIALHTSGGGFRLDQDGIRMIREWCQQNPGGLLIIDSLSAVLPPGIKESEETAGRLMRQIDVARQGNCCIVTHHSNKQSAMSGELGVYSGSGSGAIDRAVSRHIGLGYDTHRENGVEKLHTESPRRIITSQKRGAENQRIVVEMGPHGSWDYIATASEEQELKRQERDGDPTDRLSGWRLAIYRALGAQWLSTSEVTAGLEKAYAGKPTAHKQVQRGLRELADDGVIEEDRTSIGEKRWRLPA